MAKIVVVYHEKTKKIIPFKLGDMGTIVILSTNTKYNEDNLRIKTVDVRDVNFESGYLEERKYGKQKTGN